MYATYRTCCCWRSRTETAKIWYPPRYCWCYWLDHDSRSIVVLKASSLAYIQGVLQLSNLSALRATLLTKLTLSRWRLSAVSMTALL